MLPETLDCQMTQTQAWGVSLQFVGQRLPRDPQTTQALTVALGCPAELEGKTPSLKITHSLVLKPSKHQTHLISKCKGTNSEVLSQ